MIAISDNPVSMYYAGATTDSWVRHGFEVQRWEAFTPKSLPFVKDLAFGIKKFGRGGPRDFTETEKAIWYSQYYLWKMVARKSNPAIIIEHDAYLHTAPDIQNWGDYEFVGFCESWTGRNITTAAAYWLTPNWAKKLLDGIEELFPKGKKRINMNVDAYIHTIMDNNPGKGVLKKGFSRQYQDAKLGTTIHHARKDN